MGKFNLKTLKFKLSFLVILVFLTTSAFAIYPTIIVNIPFYPDDGTINLKMVVIDRDTNQIVQQSEFNNYFIHDNTISIYELTVGKKYSIFLMHWCDCVGVDNVMTPVGYLIFEVLDKNLYRFLQIPLNGGNNFGILTPPIILEEPISEDTVIDVFRFNGYSS